MSRRAGGVIWVSGLPASGKTTLARGLIEVLSARGVPTLWLDSDAIRPFLAPGAGYDEAGRDAFYRALAHIAGLGADGGVTVVVSATAVKRHHREPLREALGDRFVEVFLSAEPAVLARERDVKGLYARAASGELRDLPGVSVPFEVSARVELSLDTSALDAEAVLAATLTWLDAHRPALVGAAAV